MEYYIMYVLTVVATALLGYTLQSNCTYSRWKQMNSISLTSSVACMDDLYILAFTSGVGSAGADPDGTYKVEVVTTSETRRLPCLI